MALDFPNSPTVGQIFPSPAQPGVPQWKWDGAEWVLSAQAGSPFGVKHRVFTSTQAYTPTPGMLYANVKCKGGGGGGGGLNSVNTTQTNGAGGGADGTYSESWLTAAQIGAGLTITIGAGGAAGLGSGAVAGGTGGTTSFGSLVTAPGGGGAPSPGTGSSPSPGLAGAIGVGDISIQGSDGGEGFWYSAAQITAFGGYGAGSMLSSSKSQPNGAASSGANGANGHSYGGGGTGGSTMGVTGPVNGGAGMAGVCVVTEYGFFGTLTIPAGWVQRGALAGLTLSTAGSSATFTVAPGQCADSNAGDYIQLASAMSKTTAAWSAGSGGGSLDTGAIAANTWYHVFVIKNPAAGVVDVLISLSPTAPFTSAIFRRIGAMKTNASSQWTLFTQLGDEFLWSVPVADVNTTVLGTAATLFSLSVPSGVQVRACMRIAGVNASNWIILLTSPDEAVAATNVPSGNNTMNGPSSQTIDSVQYARTNTSGQIRAVANLASTTLLIATFGWFDTRGKDA